MQVKLKCAVIAEIKGFGANCLITLSVPIDYSDCRGNERDELADLLCNYMKDPKPLTVTIEYPHWEAK